MILAIDPGKSGALAYYRNGETTLWKMPETDGDLHDLFKEFWQSGVQRVYLEQVGGYNSSRGGQPGSAMFNFGMNFGLLKGLCLGYELPLFLVTPQKWQKALGLPGSGGDPVGHKRRLKEAAQQRHPDLKVIQQTADALLILDYARMVVNAKD